MLLQPGGYDVGHSHNAQPFVYLAHQNGAKHLQP